MIKKEYCFLILASIYSFSFCFWSRWNDGFFFLNSAAIYTKDVMEIGALYILNLWVSIFGKDILIANILGWICGVGALIVPYVGLLTPANRKLYTNYLTIGVILTGAFTYNLYSPDSATLFLTSCLSTYILKHDDLRIKHIVVLGILLGLLVCVRLPNVVSLPMIMLFLLCKKDKWVYKLFYIILVGLISSLFYVLLICLLAGTFNFSGYFFHSISEGMAAADEGHDFYTLLHSYVFCLPQLIFKSLITFILFLILKRMNAFENLFVLCCVAFFYAIFIYFYILQTELYGGLRNFFEYFSFIVILALIYESWYNRANYDFLIKNLLMIMLIFVGVAGSNTGLMKTYHLSVVLMMILLIRNDALKKFTNVVKATLIPLMFFSVCVVTCSFFINHKYETISSLPHVTQFTSNKDDKKYCDLLDETCRYTDQNAPLYMYGMDAHIMYTCTDVTMPYLLSFFMYDINKKPIVFIAQEASKHKNSVLIDYTKGRYMEKQALLFGLKKKNNTEIANVYSNK